METFHGMQTTAPAWCCPALSLALTPALQHPGLSAALLELVHCWLPRLIISSEPHSALLAEQCFFLQQWLQLADVHKAEGPLNQGRNHSKAAHEPGFCCKRSAHKFGYWGKSCSGNGSGERVTSILLNEFSQAVVSHTL